MVTSLEYIAHDGTLRLRSDSRSWREEFSQDQEHLLLEHALHKLRLLRVGLLRFRYQ